MTSVGYLELFFKVFKTNVPPAKSMGDTASSKRVRACGKNPVNGI
jgi:hypothetical protein